MLFNCFFLFIMPLNPYYISGFSDAESCFYLSLNNKNLPRFSFSIGLNSKDEELIKYINSFFNNKGRLNFYEPHNEFKLRIPQAIGLIRTGDTIQYANMILVSA